MSNRTPPTGAPSADDFIDAVANDTHKLQVVVAGPGTRKTHLFQRVLNQRPGDNLAITFINSLVRDLEKRLAGLAAVSTFHGFAKSLLHRLGVKGISNRFDYYPDSTEILCQESGWLLGSAVSKDRVTRAFHEMDDTSRVLSEYLRAANYYDVVGHDDSVYRVVTHLESNPQDIPIKNQVVVDEFQDFNQLETALIEKLSARGRVLAVGDDDQALYQFKQASPKYIRDLHGGGKYRPYELPYCFRCTEVIVNAVHDVIETAAASGMLVGRISKKFWTHAAKARDSAQHPKIIAVHCSVDTPAASYPARYLLQRIREINKVDIEDSYDDDYPTVMVIGKQNFIRPVEKLLRKHFPNNIRSKGEETPSHPLLDGYKRVDKNQHSRWGWRLVTWADPPPGLQAIISKAIADDVDVDGLLTQTYKESHLQHVQTVHDLVRGQAVAQAAVDALLARLGMTEQEVRFDLGLALAPLAPQPDPNLPTIAITNFERAKGLSAAHVFIVGMIDGHFPRVPTAITDREICEFIVALTRTRKQCYLITSGRYGRHPVVRSRFFTWIKGERLEWRKITKNDMI